MVRRLLSTRPLLAFVVLAFAGSWLWWTPMWLTRNGIGLIPVDPAPGVILLANQLGLFAGPFAAAFIVTGAVDGRSGVRSLARRIVAVRRAGWWTLVGLLAVPLVLAGVYLIGTSVQLDVATVITLVITGVVYLIGGPIQEEPGWRGFALPQLQRRMSPLPAALVLGVIHTCWHAPLFLTQDWDTPRGDVGQLLAYLVLVVALSVVLTWLTNAARGSLVPAILGHNGLNWALLVVATLTGAAVTNTWPAALAMTALALVAIVVSKGRLGGVGSRPSR